MALPADSRGVNYPLGSETSAVAASSLPLPQTSPRVLVVDGDLDNRDLYRESFTLAGWSVAEASDGREALVQALIAKPSVIVTELRLPLIDGVALCELLRRDRATATVPILVVTTETRAAELARAERAGADAVLIKPTAPDVVVAEMTRLLEQAARRRPEPALPTPGRRSALVKAHYRHATTTPDEPPASLNCPSCGRALKYHETFIGGVSSRHAERWDYYECATCGQFQYRYRTRRLKRLSS